MYTLADVTRMVGAKRRSVQFWAESGALLAMAGTEREGSGIHRVFDRDEALVACIFNGLSIFGLPVGKLITIAQGLRGSLKHPGKRQIWEDALDDRRRGLIVIHGRESSDDGVSFSGSMLSSIRYADDPFDEVLEKMASSSVQSTIVINLNACLARAREELAKK
jgi:hypothetical protein